MIWLVIVPEPAKELTSATRSPVRACHWRWNSGNTPLSMTSRRMLNP